MHSAALVVWVVTRLLTLQHCVGRATRRYSGQWCEYEVLFNTPFPSKEPDVQHCLTGTYEAASGRCLCGGPYTGALCDITTYDNKWLHVPRLGVGCHNDSVCGSGFCNANNGLCVCPQDSRGLHCEYPYTLRVNDDAQAALVTLTQPNCSTHAMFECVPACPLPPPPPPFQAWQCALVVVLTVARLLSLRPNVPQARHCPVRLPRRLDWCRVRCGGGERRLWLHV